MQTVTDLSMDKVDPDSLQLLMDKGDDMWDESKVKVKKMINSICDERFAPKD